jgi:outer membrane protein OmpA-like peptidoglycan-associated protein
LVKLRFTTKKRRRIDSRWYGDGCNEVGLVVREESADFDPGSVWQRLNCKNNANNVTMALTSQTQGLNIGIAGGGVTVSMPVPPAAAPRTLVLEFGYDKDWLNKANKARIDDFLATWKCRYGTIEIIGHTDAVGKEDENLHLSVNRATAVRDYIIGAGVYATRIAPLAAGENNQQVPTYQGVRLRANRVVVVSIK